MRTAMVAGGLVAAATAILLIQTPAAAAVDYTLVTHTDTEGVDVVADGTATVEADGLRMATPTDAAKVTFQVGLIDDPLSPSSVVLLGAVQDLSYKTIKYDTAAPVVLPAYKLEIICNPFADPEDLFATYTTLVFEPYLQDPAPDQGNFDEWQTWDVLNGTFWSTRALPGVAGGDHSEQLTLAQVLEKCPAAIVLSYQVGQGSSNAGADAKTDHVRFAAEALLLDGLPEPEIAEGSVAALASTTDVQLETELIATEHIWRKPAEPVGPGNAPQLPATGVDTTPYVTLGLTLIVLGSVLVAFAARRRRSTVG